MWPLKVLEQNLKGGNIFISHILWSVSIFCLICLCLLLILHLAGTEWKRIAAVLQRCGDQCGGECRHHGWGRHPLPSPDEPGSGFNPGRPGHHGEHPQPVVLLPEPGHGGWDYMNIHISTSKSWPKTEPKLKPNHTPWLNQMRYWDLNFYCSCFVLRLTAGEAGWVSAQGSGRFSWRSRSKRPTQSPCQPGPRPVQSPGCCHGVHPQHLHSHC